MMLNGNNQTVPQVVVEDIDGQDNAPEQPVNDPVQVHQEDSGESTESTAVDPAQADESGDSTLTESDPSPDPAQVSELHGQIDETASNASPTSAISDQPTEEISQLKKSDSDQLVESMQIKTEPTSDSDELSLAKVKQETVSDTSGQSAEVPSKTVKDLIQSLEDCSLKETVPNLISFEGSPKLKSDDAASSDVKPEHTADADHSEPSQLPPKVTNEQVQTSETAIQLKPESADVLPDAKTSAIKATTISNANHPVETASKGASKPASESVKLGHEPHEVPAESITNPDVQLKSKEKSPDSKEESAQGSAVSAQSTNLPA